MLDLKTGNFINGELVDGDTEKLLVSINPATGSQLTEIKLASLQQANHTVEIAKKNQKNGRNCRVKNVDVFFIKLRN